MADDKKTSNANIHTSYVGTFKADSLDVDDKGVASAILETPGAKGETVERVVKGYNDNAKTLQDAVKAAGKDEVILRGTLLGGSKNPHLGVYGVGPEQVTGKVSNVKVSGEGKEPFVGAFVQVERGEHKIGRPIAAFGDDAKALEGLKNGDRIEVPARQTQEKRGDNWAPVYRVTGPGKIEPAAEKAKEEDTPTP